MIGVQSFSFSTLAEKADALGNSQIIKYPFQKCPGKDLSGFENLTGLDMGILIFASYLSTPPDKIKLTKY